MQLGDSQDYQQSPLQELLQMEERSGIVKETNQDWCFTLFGEFRCIVWYGSKQCHVMWQLYHPWQSFGSKRDLKCSSNWVYSLTISCCSGDLMRIEIVMHVRTCICVVFIFRCLLRLLHFFLSVEWKTSFCLLQLFHVQLAVNRTWAYTSLTCIYI